MIVDFRVNGAWVGSTVQADRFGFTADVVGTADIEQIDLVVNGDTARSYTPSQQHVQLEDEVPLRFSPMTPTIATYAFASKTAIARGRAQSGWSPPSLRRKPESRRCTKLNQSNLRNQELSDGRH